jgi:hypothetical protein
MADKGATVSVVGGVISVVPDPIPVGRGANSKITWDLDKPSIDAGWRFTSNGIVVTNGGSQFYVDPNDPNNDSKKFKLKDKNDNSLSYKYTINLVNGTTSKSLDPAIQNGGDGGPMPT